jgi:hypothetical protein
MLHLNVVYNQGALNAQYAFDYSKALLLVSVGGAFIVPKEFKLIVNFTLLDKSSKSLLSISNGSPNDSWKQNKWQFKPNKLIVIYFKSKIFLHFCKGCKTFCEGERNDPIGLTSLVYLISLVSLGFVCCKELISIFGFNGLNGLAGIIRLIGFSLNGFTGIGFILGIVGLIEFIKPSTLLASLLALSATLALMATRASLAMAALTTLA